MYKGVTLSHKKSSQVRHAWHPSAGEGPQGKKQAMPSRPGLTCWYSERKKFPSLPKNLSVSYATEQNLERGGWRGMRFNKAGCDTFGPPQKNRPNHTLDNLAHGNAIAAFSSLKNQLLGDV